MTVEKDHSEYEGKPSLTMDFTPGGVDDATIKQLKENGTEGGNTVSFHINGGGMTLLRQGLGPCTSSGNPFCRMGAGHDQNLDSTRGPLFRTSAT